MTVLLANSRLSWWISDVKMKAQEARFWATTKKVRKGSMQRRDEGRSFGKPLVVYRTVVFRNNQQSRVWVDSQ